MGIKVYAPLAPHGRLVLAVVGFLFCLTLLGFFRTHTPITGLLSRPGLTSRHRRVLIKVGGVPQEGFGSSLHFIKDAMRMAGVLGVDFAPVRTFDFAEFNYNAMDELNLGIDFSQYNWNNMCNLHTSITKVGGHENFPERVVRLRKGVDRFADEAKLVSKGLPHDGAYIDEVRANVAGCDVILFADQEVHQAPDWDRFPREWVRNAITRNASIKIAQRKAKAVAPRDVHIHYRWGDVVSKIKEHHDGGKWNFDNEALEHTIASVETCLGRKLSSNVFMKRSPWQESDEELRRIIAPIRQDARIVEGEDDIADLLHLSEAKILAVTGGTYSSAAAAIGRFSLVIHNGWHVGDYDHLVADGVPLVEQGHTLTDEQCAHVRTTF